MLKFGLKIICTPQVYMRCSHLRCTNTAFPKDYTSYKACMKVSNAWKELLSLEPFQSKAKALFHEEITLDEKKLWLTSQRGDVKGVKRLLSSGMLDVNCVSVATCQQRVHHNPWIYPSICDYL